MTTDLSNQGENVRKAFRFVVGRVYVSRETRAIETLREIFGGDWILLRDGKRAEMKYLVKHTRVMKEIRDFNVKVSHAIEDPEQEEIALRQRPRLWLDELKNLVANEPGLVLRTVPTKQQSTVQQPAAELATV